MEKTKISDLRLGDWSAPVSTLPDVPTDVMSAQELKERFDSNSNELKESFNGLLGALNALGVEEYSVINEDTGYTKEQTEQRLLEKADKDSVYTKTETDGKINEININLMANYYTQDAVNNKLEALYVSKNEHTADMSKKADLHNGKIPASQLPSYVDDIIEGLHPDNPVASGSGAEFAFPAAGESGKIYIDINTGVCYRWSGSKYAEISASLALGTTESTAYPGNLGEQNAKAIVGHASDINSLASQVNEIRESMGDVSRALDELHAYAQGIISGGAGV